MLIKSDKWPFHQCTLYIINEKNALHFLIFYRISLNYFNFKTFRDKNLCYASILVSYSKRKQQLGNVCLCFVWYKNLMPDLASQNLAPVCYKFFYLIIFQF